MVSQLSEASFFTQALSASTCLAGDSVSHSYQYKPMDNSKREAGVVEQDAADLRLTPLQGHTFKASIQE